MLLSDVHPGFVFFVFHLPNSGMRVVVLSVYFIFSSFVLSLTMPLQHGRLCFLLIVCSLWLGSNLNAPASLLGVFVLLLSLCWTLNYRSLVLSLVCSNFHSPITLASLRFLTLILLSNNFQLGSPFLLMSASFHLIIFLRLSNPSVFRFLLSQRAVTLPYFVVASDYALCLFGWVTLTTLVLSCLTLIFAHRVALWRSFWLVYAQDMSSSITIFTNFLWLHSLFAPTVFQRKLFIICFSFVRLIITIVTISLRICP